MAVDGCRARAGSRGRGPLTRRPYPGRCKHPTGSRWKGESHGDLPPRGQAGPERDAGRRGPARTRVFRAPARPERPQPAGQLRHQRAPRLAAARHVHRGAHPGHHPGHLRLPPQPGHRRPALHGQGHARAVRAGPAHGAGGPGGQRRGDHHPARRRRHADAGHLAGHPRLQPRAQGAPRATASSSRRRTIRPRTAASSTTRPTAARPTPT